MLKIYNSLTRQKEEFRPLREGEVGMYVCGPTVYDVPHVGHARSAYIFDVIRRYLVYRGFKVKFVRNVTDVDDKIINKAKEEYSGKDIKEAARDVAVKYLDAYHRGMDALGILRPDAEPKATGYIDRMIEFIDMLITRGFAYESGGDVYLSVDKINGYGRLSNQSTESLLSGARIAPGEKKKGALDFALWKTAKKDEPSWHSPWGDGRPGWHIECSVMSSDILGDRFDIHGGGIDLIFPHHENEVAQSQGAGKRFANYWIHNGLLTINKEKMAKSLGNFFTIEDVLKKYPPEALKILYLQAHYASPVDFSWERLDDAKRSYERINILMEKLSKSDALNQAGRDEKLFSRLKDSFIAAMDDDFNTPAGLASVFAAVNNCNKLLDAPGEKDYPSLAAMNGFMLESAGIYGLNFGAKSSGGISDGEIADKIRLRAELKNSKNFRDADAIRDELEKKGVILEDGKDGTTWRRKI